LDESGIEDVSILYLWSRYLLC